METTYEIKYKIAVNLIKKGYIIHCTDANFKHFDPSKIKGGSRANEGYGIYFSDMPYKPIEYGDIFKAVKKDDFNFINSKDPIEKYSYIFYNDILREIYRLEDKIDAIRNIREYDEINAEILRLRNEYEQIGGDELFNSINIAIKHFKAKTIGGLEYNMPNPDVMIPKLAQLYIKYGFDGYETDGIYTIFNFDKLNKLVTDVDTKNINVNESLDLSSFEVKNDLNPDFWKDEKLDSRVRLKLLDIADDFTDFLNVDWVKPKDITMTGSLANYNWSDEFSDIDLHIIIKYSEVDKRRDFVQNYFKAKKELWNQEHQQIKIYGFPVELYVQDEDEKHMSSGVYSLEKNEWLVKPEKKKIPKQNLLKAEKNAESWISKIDSLIDRYYPDSTESQKEDIISDLDAIISNIKDTRKSGLNKSGGEVNQDNLTFKILRRNGYLDKIWDKKTEIYDDLMSINEGIGNSDTLIIYHRVDWDGYTSGAVALKAFPNSDVYGWNYGDELPDVSMYDTVIVVDLTLSDKNGYDWMNKNAKKIIWIDHHSNAISGVSNNNIKGLRKDGVGACILTWNYFFPGVKMPAHVALCGTYDVFKKDGEYAKWEDAWAYQLALNKIASGSAREGNNSVIFLKKALSFMEEPLKETIDRINYGFQLEQDRSLKEKETFINAKFVNRGNVRICKLISDGQPAMLIKNNSDNHTADLFVIRSLNPIKTDETKYKIALRVPEKSNIDASQIAREYGGNGHKKAAGCLMTLDEFDNL